MTVTKAVLLHAPRASTILRCVLLTIKEAVIDAGVIVSETLTLKAEVVPDDGKRENIVIGEGSKYFAEPAYSCKPSLGCSKTQTFPAPLVHVRIESKSLPVPHEMPGWYEAATRVSASRHPDCCKLRTKQAEYEEQGGPVMVGLVAEDDTTKCCKNSLNFVVVAELPGVGFGMRDG